MKNRQYAASTQVPVDRSRSEIEKLLGRYGASHFAYATSPEGAVIAFQAMGRRVKMSVPLPSRKELEVTSKGIVRTEKQLDGAFEQQQRQRWRSLALVVKAKFEATESGVATFEQEFLPYILLPGKKGQTVSEWLEPQLRIAYDTNTVPQNLLGE